jgi:transposase-like protein
MADKRRKFDAEFREGVGRIVAEIGKPLAHVVKDLGINETTLASWVSRARRAAAGSRRAAAGPVRCFLGPRPPELLTAGEQAMVRGHAVRLPRWTTYWAGAFQAPLDGPGRVRPGSCRGQLAVVLAVGGSARGGGGEVGR